MTTGGMVLIQPAAETLAAAKLSAGEMALEVKSVGKFGPHAAAQNAGFQPGDLIVSYDNQTDFKSEADLFLYAVNQKKTGDKVSVDVVRKGQRKTLRLPIQE